MLPITISRFDAGFIYWLITQKSLNAVVNIAVHFHLMPTISSK
jgi:hypothetical protein